MLKNTQNWRITGDELRLEARHRTLIPGVINTYGDGAGIECIIRDFSDDGARLYVENGFSLPLHFKLKTETHAAGYNCQVVWRKFNEVGIRFIEG